MKKRIVLSIILIILIIISIIGYARFIEPNLLTLHSLEVKTKMTVKPISIAFFTDTHFGKYYKSNHISRIVEKINETEADIVIFGGDLLDNYARDRDNLDLDYIKSELNKVKAKIGKYAVWGNHDYGGGAVRIYEDLLTSSGFEVLNDNSIELENYGIKIIGYDDFLMGYTDPSLYEIKSDLFNIIVSHEPKISQYIKNNSDNYILTGHTHGGQVSIPFLTDKLLPEGSGKFIKGVYTEDEIGTSNLKMYVSSGIGMTRYPFRFLNVPEIVKIEVKSSN